MGCYQNGLAQRWPSSGIQIQFGQQSHKHIERGLAVESLQALQHIVIVDQAVTQAETAEAPRGQFAVVQHLQVDVAAVPADALQQRQHLFLPAFKLLAKAHAVKNQQPGDVALRVGQAGLGGDVPDEAQRGFGRQGADVKDFLQRGAYFCHCGSM